MKTSEHPYHVQGQIRDGGRCVYCGRDLMIDFDVFWGFLSNDHLVPDAGDTLSNHATACRSCNALKGNFKPIASDSMSREELIDAARIYIAQKRAEKLKEFLDRLQVVRGM
ncbi:MAG TPA: HNH endonuclease [Planctomycetaceae bacterium]|nr:HNH endonuclease [Planctomycetaceae bacterium]